MSKYTFWFLMYFFIYAIMDVYAFDHSVKVFENIIFSGMACAVVFFLDNVRG